MKYISLLAILVLLGCDRPKAIDTATLAIELDSIMKEDQKYRSLMQTVQQKHGWNSPEMDTLWKHQEQTDESNLKRIREIIHLTGGYPGKTLVGSSASEAAFYVLQHAPDSIQEQYYDMIVEAARQDELNKRLAAMYQDRYLMHRGEDQIFGTQIRTEFKTDSLTGERIDKTFLWPIADTTRIDSLRMHHGMMPLEDYLRRFGLSRWK